MPEAATRREIPPLPDFLAEIESLVAPGPKRDRLIIACALASCAWEVGDLNDRLTSVERALHRLRETINTWAQDA